MYSKSLSVLDRVDRVVVDIVADMAPSQLLDLVGQSGSNLTDESSKELLVLLSFIARPASYKLWLHLRAGRLA